MTVEEIISKLPISITKTVEKNCLCCGQKQKVKIKYELKLKVWRSSVLTNTGYEPQDRYYAYYKTRDLSDGNSEKYIGRVGGIGQLTLTDALLELQGYIKNE